MDENSQQPPFNPPPPNYTPPPPLAAPPPPVISQHTMSPPPRKGGRGWMVLSIVLLVLLVLLVFGRIAVGMVFSGKGAASEDRTKSLEEVVIERTNTDDKVAVVEISGVISGGEVDKSGLDLEEYVKAQFKEAAKDGDVKAVILKVDSPGGEVLAADEVHNVIKDFQSSTGKPVVVSMGSLAASGGYYVSAPCRWIVANELTITGSVGVIMHGYNYRGLMDKVGVRPQVFKSGRFKDMLSGEDEPDADKLTPEQQRNRAEEEAMVQGLIDETFGKFKDVVRTGRQWAASQNGTEGRTLVTNWTDYADGRVLSGTKAYELGFVDELGDFNTAVRRAEKLAKIGGATLVEYRVPFDLASAVAHLMGKSEVPGIKVDLGFDLPKLEAGREYFMMPMAVAH